MSLLVETGAGLLALAAVLALMSRSIRNRWAVFGILAAAAILLSILLFRVVLAMLGG